MSRILDMVTSLLRRHRPPQPPPPVPPPPAPSLVLSGATYYSDGLAFGFTCYQLLDANRVEVSRMQAQQDGNFSFTAPANGIYYVRPMLEVWAGAYNAQPSEYQINVCGPQSGLNFTIGNANYYAMGAPLSVPCGGPVPSPSPPPAPTPKTVRMTATVTPAAVDALTFALTSPDNSVSTQSATSDGSGVVSVDFPLPLGAPVATYRCSVEGPGISDSTSITC